MSPWQYAFSPLDGGEDEKPGSYPRNFPRLSFGVELEFSLATLSRDREDPEPDGRQVYGIAEIEKPDSSSLGRISLFRRIERADNTQRHLAKTLVGEGFRAIAEADTQQDAPDIPLDRWIVTQDPSIQQPPVQGNIGKYSFQKIEMQSPAYLMTEGSLREVQRVCHLVTRTYRTYTGESTGLHVHCGNSARGLPLETVQNVMAILFAFEPQFDLLHPEHRRNNRWCVPLRGSSRLALRMVENNIDLPDSIAEIYKTTSINQLIKLMGAHDNSGHKMRVNIHNLLEAYVDDDGELRQRHDESKRTIEFRQHEGTLDPEAIYFWSKTCVNFVEFAQEVSTPKLRAWLRWTIDEKVENYPAVAVLYAMKIPTCALYYERKLAERDGASTRP
jgi:hypothetical protein